MHEYILQGWYIFAHSRMPQPFSTDILLSGSVSIPVHLEPDILPQKVDHVSSSGLVFSTAHHLILTMALKSRFANSMHFFSLVILIGARSPRMRALNATCSSVMSLSISIAEAIRCLLSISTL